MQPIGLTNTTLVFRYALFAAIASLANIAMQSIVVRTSPGAPLIFSLVAGTGAGFVCKFLLDKRWIFFDRWAGYAHEARKVSLYGVFGLLLTFMFWGTEVAFLLTWNTSFAKYSGAILGLIVGYAAKFFLDRRFVFTAENSPRFHEPIPIVERSRKF